MAHKKVATKKIWLKYFFKPFAKINLFIALIIEKFKESFDLYLGISSIQNIPGINIF